MTLNVLNGHFTINFQYYELTLRVIIYLFTVESVYMHSYTRDQRRCAEVDRDPQNNWNPRKKLRILHSRYIVGTLANKANIIVFSIS